MKAIIFLLFAAVLMASIESPGPASQASAQASRRQAVPDAAGDGPYVMWRKGGLTARSVSPGLKPVDRPLKAEGIVSVAAVGSVPGFEVALRAPLGAPSVDMSPLEESAKLMVLADTHGEYEIMVAFLQRQGVIDEKLRWAFGNGHLVVTGDMFDRGPHQLEILWLLYKLEAEAKTAGGALHVLLGNHESMILRGDERYLHPRYAEVAKILGVGSYSDLFGPETVLGNWLRSKPAVLKLGKLLFVHGGISPQILDAGLTISDLNAGIRKAVATPESDNEKLDPQTRLITGTFGPQWFRGYFHELAERDRPYMIREDVERSLKAFGVERILVGHTQGPEVAPLYNGRVIAVHVYPHLDKGTGDPVLEGALWENQRWFRVTASGARLPLMIIDFWMTGDPNSAGQ